MALFQTAVKGANRIRSCKGTLEVVFQTPLQSARVKGLLRNNHVNDSEKVCVGR